MRPVTVTVGPLAAASTTAIALSQTPTGAGYLTLNGTSVVNGVAVLDTPRRVLITEAGTNTFIITGTNASGMPQSETLNVTTPSAYTALDYATITSIYITAAAAAAVTVGTNGVASSPWVRFDEWANAQSTVGCYVTGTVNYTVQIAMLDPNDPNVGLAPYQIPWLNSLDTNVVNATASQNSFFAQSPIFAKVTLNSGTGSVQSVFAQFSNAPY